MDIWIVTTGEPLPGTGARLWRSGAMASVFAREGHAVTWWTGDFDHFVRRHVAPGEVARGAPAGVEVRLLKGRAYAGNMSLARVLNHVDLARRFRRDAAIAQRPDLVVCSYPPAELASAAVAFGRARDIPVFLDVRDLWPDVWVESARGPKRLAARAAAPAYARLAASAFRDATGVLGTTESFVAWGARRADREPRATDLVVPIGYPRWERLEGARVEGILATLAVRRDVPLRVVFLGTLGAQFDLDPVLKAAAGLSGGEATFVIAGGGESLAAVRSAAAHLPHVLVPGRVDDEVVRALLQWGNVGLAPYRDTEHWRQNVGNKPYEYMSGGLAVLGGVGGALADLVARHACGATYAPRRPDSLRDLLRAYLDDPALLDRAGANARLAFEKHFSCDRTYGGLAEELARRADLLPRKAATPR